MKLKDTLALIKAGYTRDEIKAFEAESPEDPAPEAGDGIVKALGLMAGQLNALQAQFTKQAGASETKEESIEEILAKLQGSGEED